MPQYLGSSKISLKACTLMCTESTSRAKEKPIEIQMDPEGEQHKKLKRRFIVGNKIKLKYHRKSYLAKKKNKTCTSASFSSLARMIQNEGFSKKKRFSLFFSC